MKLFIYGTLADESIQQHLYGRTLEMTPARLPNYVVTDAVDSEGDILPYKTIVHSEGINISAMGHIIDLSEQEMARTDKYEGVPNLYQRIHVEVIDEQNNIIPCISYINGHLLDKVAKMKAIVMPDISNQVISENNFTKAYIFDGTYIYISKAYDEDSDVHFLVNSIPELAEVNAHHIQFPIPFNSEEERDKTFDELDLEHAGELIKMFIDSIKQNAANFKSSNNGN